MAERIDMTEFQLWRELPPQQRAKHEKLIKIYNLTPFLYSQICQPDNWIKYIHQVGLLPSESVGVHNSGPITRQLFDKVCLVEECNDLVTTEMVKEGHLEKIEALLQTIYETTPIKDVVRKAGSNSIVKRWKEKISNKETDTVSVALLFVSWQYVDHVHTYMRDKKDPDKEFTELCDLEDEKVLKEKRKGNAEFKDEKYGSALSSYTNGLCRSLYNYILYGNRSLAHLKLRQNWEAMCDGFRCVVLKPDWPKGQYRYAEAWYSLGKLDKAITVVQTAITLNPKDKDLRDQENRFVTERKKRKQPSSKSRTTNGYDQKTASCQTDSVFQFTGKDHSQADSDSDLPDLVTSDDDSDGAKPHDGASHTNNIMTLPRTRPVATREMSASERLTQLLKHGSEALLQHKPARALQEYTEAQSVITKHKNWSDLMKEMDYVVLLYAVGTAHIDMFTFKHVQEGLARYETILKAHSKVSFPLVYLGLGRAYHRQNRFSKALVPLRKGLAEKRRHDTHNWPGTRTMIQESRPDLLKMAVKELMHLCKYPPPPIAICRYEDCINNHYKVDIYTNDLDFKGYVVIHCFDHCAVAYHPDCWKYLKGKLRSSDKDILQGKCFTPDCGADIEGICSHDEDCVVHKKTNEKPAQVHKEKKKIVKMLPSSQYKIARKREKLAIRKQKKQEAREEGEGATVTPDTIVEEKKEKKTKAADLIYSQPAVGESGDTAINTSQPKAIVTVLHHGPGGEGGEDIDLFVGSRQNHKPKNKKKKGGLKPTKVTMSLCEFVSDVIDDDASEQNYGLKEFDCLDDFDDDYSYLRAPSKGIVDGSRHPDPTETKDEIFSYFVNVLQHHGPTHTADPLLQGELLALSEDSRRMIEDANGLRNFLLQSPAFDVVDDFLCLADDSQYQTPPKSYPDNNTSLPQTNVTVADGIVRNESVSRSKDSFDMDSVSSEGSWHSATKTTSSTAQLAEIPLKDMKRSVLCSDSKNSLSYIDQETEKPSELSEYSSSDYFRPESVPWYSGGGTSEYLHLDENDLPQTSDEPLQTVDYPREKVANMPESVPWYSGGTSDYSDLDESDLPQTSDEPPWEKVANPLEMVDDSPPTVDDHEDELSDDEIEFLKANRQFQPASTAANNAADDTDLKRTVPLQFLASVPSMSVTSLPTTPVASVPTTPIASASPQLIPPSPEAMYFASVPKQSVALIQSQSVISPPHQPPPQSNGAFSSHSVSSLATFSNYACVPTLPRQHQPMSNSNVYTGPFSLPPVSVIGHNYMTVPQVPPDFSYAQLNPVPASSPADKAYILELEEKMEDLKQIIMKEQDKFTQLQRESDARYNALQMESAKSLSISDERINSLLREYAKLKESDDAHIGSLFIQVEKLRQEIQERGNVAAEFESAKFLWHEERNALTSEIQALQTQLLNSKLSEERSSAIIQEKEGNISALTNDLSREREIRNLQQAELASLESRLAAALSRAQTSEVELLKLKLDVGMQILSRSESDATLFSNMYTKQAKEMETKNPTMSSSIQAAGAEWLKTANTLRAMKADTEKSFKDQIAKVEGGQPLGDLPKLPLPKPPQPPKTPMLPPAMLHPEARMRQTTPPKKLPNYTQPTSALSSMPAPITLGATAAPGGATHSLTNHKAPVAVKVPSVVNSSAQLAPVKPPTTQARVRPSKPMEKIMQALHLVYPAYSRLQLKHYIDELRAIRHGSLTGMKFEDIVNSVSAIIEGHAPNIGVKRASPLDTFTLPPSSRSDTSSPGFFEEEEDPCIICHDELDTGLIFKLGCSHRFHKTCIDQWLQNHNTCPTCREPIALKTTK